MRLNRTISAITIALALALGGLACSQAPEREVDVEETVAVEAVETGAAQTPWGTPLPFGLDPDISVPADNPMNPEKIALGKLLFFDSRLSADATISCATCHVPASGGTDNRATSAGIRGQTGGRSAPSVVNTAYVLPHFWDGRAATLEEQAKGPQINPIEMGNPDLESVAQRIGGIGGYPALFQAAFGTPEVTADRIAQAIASYERTLLSGNSPFDRFQAGDKSALSEQQQMGLTLFMGKALCVTCHVGPNLTDNGFHNIVVGTQRAEAEVDVGRMEVSGDANDWAAF